jgi:hypothetical protein
MEAEVTGNIPLWISMSRFEQLEGLFEHWLTTREFEELWGAFERRGKAKP